MLPLVDAFIEAGHSVRWASAREACVALQERGYDVVSAGAHDLGMPELPPEVLALPARERPEYGFAFFFGPRRAAPMLPDLLSIIDEWQPELLVCDQAELAGPIAAAKAGVPNVTHSFGRLLPAARVARAAHAVADLWRSQGLEPRPYAGTYDHLYLDIYPPSLQTSDANHVG